MNWNFRLPFCSRRTSMSLFFICYTFAPVFLALLCWVCRSIAATYFWICIFIIFLISGSIPSQPPCPVVVPVPSASKKCFSLFAWFFFWYISFYSQILWPGPCILVDVPNSSSFIFAFQFLFPEPGGPVPVSWLVFQGLLGFSFVFHDLVLISYFVVLVTVYFLHFNFYL